MFWYTQSKQSTLMQLIPALRGVSVLGAPGEFQHDSHWEVCTRRSRDILSGERTSGTFHGYLLSGRDAA